MMSETGGSIHPRVVVGIDQSVAGYAALREAVGIARKVRAPLYAIRAACGLADERDKSYVDTAFREALGEMPWDVEVHTEIADNCASSALAASGSDPRDLIIIGNSGHGMLHAFWSGSVGRSLFKQARCQILVVPAPEMLHATRRSVRKLRAGRTDVWDRFETEAPELHGRPYQGA